MREGWELTGIEPFLDNVPYVLHRRRDDATTPRRPDDKVHLSVRRLDDRGRDRGERPLERPDVVVGRRQVPEEVGDARRAEVVHLVVQYDTVLRRALAGGRGEGGGGRGGGTEGVITRLPKKVLIVVVSETAVPSESSVAMWDVPPLLRRSTLVAEARNRRGQLTASHWPFPACRRTRCSAALRRLGSSP